MTLLRRLTADQRASGAAEFALVLPLLLTLMFVAIDGGRYLYDSNRIEKATQFGARFAVVTDPVASDLITTDYVGQVVNGVTLTQGDRIPAGALATITCSSTSCGAGHTFNSTAFQNVVNRMKLIVPQLQASNVTVTYSGSGLGYAGDPSGMQVSPLVTIQISGLTWQPVSGFTLVNAHYPTISTTLSAEDSVGSQSY
jgi:Flp pilus assembly protein TadG